MKLFYPSVNHEPEVFGADAEVFDITRTRRMPDLKNQHRTFGVGQHFCIGSHLARKELCVMFEEIIPRLRNPRLVRSPAQSCFQLYPRHQENAYHVRPGKNSSYTSITREEMTMLQKFIWWTGLSDFLVGAGTWFGAVSIAMAAEPVKGQVVPLITLGTFLIMAAALLMWSSHDMANRAPVFFWQGLVRLSAVAAVIYAVPHQLAETWEYALLAIDGPIGLVYVFGAMKVTGCSFVQLLGCKTMP